jgi:hypothetical protein
MGITPVICDSVADTTVIGQPEPEANPIEPDLLPSMPEPSTKLDDQAIAFTIQPNLPLTDETSVEAVTQGFTAVTVARQTNHLTNQQSHRHPAPSMMRTVSAIM